MDADRLRELARALGFRRVERVRLVVGEAGTTAEVTGVLHRCPRTVKVPLRAAARLAAAGARLEVVGLGVRAGV